MLFVFVAILLLAGCGDKNNYNVSDKEKPKVEVISEKEHNITLVTNDDLEITLNSSKHERSKELDTVEFLMTIENKKNKTFEYNFRNLQLDSNRNVGLGMDTFEVKPNETIQIKVTGMDTSHLEFEEYIGGEFVYNAYDSDIRTDEVAFSEYIN